MKERSQIVPFAENAGDTVVIERKNADIFCTELTAPVHEET